MSEESKPIPDIRPTTLKKQVDVELLAALVPIETILQMILSDKEIIKRLIGLKTLNRGQVMRSLSKIMMQSAFSVGHLCEMEVKPSAQATGLDILLVNLDNVRSQVSNRLDALVKEHNLTKRKIDPETGKIENAAEAAPHAAANEEEPDATS